MSEYPFHTHFPGRLIFIGFGSIGQGVLPLILRHVGGLAAERITIVTADDAAGLERVVRVRIHHADRHDGHDPLPGPVVARVRDDDRVDVPRR